MCKVTKVVQAYSVW